jgi:hypothetical protein
VTDTTARNRTHTPAAEPAEAQAQEAWIDRLAGLLVRGVGFSVLTGMSLSLLAAVVLLPAWGRYAVLRYQRDCKARDVREAEMTLAAMDRLLEDVRKDEVLTQRLAWSRLGLCPSGEVRVLPRDRRDETQPGSLSKIRLPDPPGPNGKLLGLARRTNESRRRRGMLALAGGMLIAALLLFTPPERSELSK